MRWISNFYGYGMDISWIWLGYRGGGDISAFQTFFLAFGSMSNHLLNSMVYIIYLNLLYLKSNLFPFMKVVCKMGVLALMGSFPINFALKIMAYGAVNFGDGPH